MAPTSMAEERQRGSLDLLAATTLSTPTIVLGKWLAMLRPVAAPGDRAWIAGCRPGPGRKGPADDPSGNPGLVLRRIVRRGAALRCLPPDHDDPRTRHVDRKRRPGARSLDLRQSRAIALNVGLAVIVGAGWPMLVTAMRTGPQGRGLMCLSPVVAVFQLFGIVANAASGATSSGGSRSGTSSAWPWPWGSCG